MNPLLARLMSMLAGPGDAQVLDLARLLDVPTEALKSIPTNRKLSYRPFTIRKRDGHSRQIVAPSSPLKQLQRRLLRRYLAKQPLHEAATAFRPGGSIAVHARRHLGQAMILTVDLADFFPATSAWRVRTWFAEQGWQEKSLDVLMRLCVYRGGLAQGAPTSPALSNLVNRPLDKTLAQLAAWHGGRYSRYADDLAFSWGTDVEPPAFRLEVASALQQFGYQIQERKGWRLQHANQQPVITGLVLQGRGLRLSDTILARLRSARNNWRIGDAASEARLQGYLGLREMLKPRRFFRKRRGS